MMSFNFHLRLNSKTCDLLVHNVNFYNTSSFLKKLSRFIIILKLEVNPSVGLPIDKNQLEV